MENPNDPEEDVGETNVPWWLAAVLIGLTLFAFLYVFPTLVRPPADKGDPRWPTTNR